MSDRSAAEAFAAELQRLYEAAGKPMLATLIRQGRAQQPAVTLNDATMSDWLSGTSVPRDPVPVRFMVTYLERLAAERTGHPQRGATWWLNLRQLASEQTHARRGGRPRTSTKPAHAHARLGRVIRELEEKDALGLEVHQAVTVKHQAEGLSVLPRYLQRDHDRRLREELAAADQGISRLVMLVGGSSTGKTRACWEAIRAMLPHWRVWHPLSPERPEAVIEALTSGLVGPRTVIWLNEAQMYLQPAGAGERVATALQELLRRSDSGPVVVLGSMWREYWEVLTDPKSSTHAAARALLLSHDIAMPFRFEPADLTRGREQIAADPRLRLAIDQGGERITQHLAGGPELERRYERADEYSRAVVWAAMDACRLSRWRYLPREFLYRAAIGYLDRQVWDFTDDGDHWFDRAVTYLSEPCHGAPGPLARRKPLPDETNHGTVQYRLADYLEQIGRQERGRYCPPGTLWTAAGSTCTDPGVLLDLAQAADRRGRFQRAYQLFRYAANLGDTEALLKFALLRERVGDVAGAEQLAREAADRGQTYALRELAERRERAGTWPAPNDFSGRPPT